MKTTKGSLQQNVNEFLRQYRKAPHATTGQTPSQLFLGRTIRTRLDLVRPEPVQTRITERQTGEVVPTFRTFQPRQSVYFLAGNPRLDRWIPGTIVARWGDIHYEIEYAGRTFKRHVDQIRNFNPEGPLRATQTTRGRRRVQYRERQTELQQPENREQGGELTASDGPAIPPTQPTAPDGPAIPPTQTRTGDATQNEVAVPIPRRSTRVRKQTELFTPLGAGRFL